MNTDIGAGGNFGAAGGVTCLKAPRPAIGQTGGAGCRGDCRRGFLQPAAASPAPAPVVNPTAAQAPGSLLCIDRQSLCSLRCFIHSRPHSPPTTDELVKGKGSARKCGGHARAGTDEDGLDQHYQRTGGGKDLNIAGSRLRVEKPAAGEEAVATAPAEEPEVVDLQYQYPASSCLKSLPRVTRCPG